MIPKKIIDKAEFVITTLLGGLVLGLVISSIFSAIAGNYSKAIYLVLLAILLNNGSVSATVSSLFEDYDNEE